MTDTFRFPVGTPFDAAGLDEAGMISISYSTDVSEGADTKTDDVLHRPAYQPGSRGRFVRAIHP